MAMSVFREGKLYVLTGLLLTVLVGEFPRSDELGWNPHVRDSPCGRDLVERALNLLHSPWSYNL